MRIQTFGYLTVAELPQVDIVDVAARAGFRSVGLRVEERRAGDGYEHVIVRRPDSIRAIRAKLETTGLRLSNVVGRYLVSGTTREDIEALVDTGAALGCRYVLANAHDADAGRTRDNLALLAERAGQAGLLVAIEFVPYQGIRSLKEAMHYVRAVDSPYLGLVPDPLHLSRAGETPTELAAVPPERIFYAQICDAAADRPATLDGCLDEARKARRLLGEGGLPLDAYLRALPAECELEIEVANEGLAKAPPLERATVVKQSLERFLASEPA